MATLFFSYSSRDRPLAQQLVTKLSQLGHRIAIDTDSLVPGVEWRREMKFPEKLKMSDRHVRLLEDIFEVIRAEAARHRLVARRADQKHYHDQLWENICVYVIGSKYGIAVLEDEVAAELNPNVALEYGFNEGP